MVASSAAEATLLALGRAATVVPEAELVQLADRILGSEVRPRLRARRLSPA